MAPIIRKLTWFIVDIPIIVPEHDQLIFTERYMGKGVQPGEVELSDEAVPSLPEFNATAMAQLEAMGFPTTRCQKALLATGNCDSEAAMEWLFAHMDDPDADAPIQLSSESSGSEGHRTVEPDPIQVACLADMGFAVPQARKALRETVSTFHIVSRLGIFLKICRVAILAVQLNGCSAILMILVTMPPVLRRRLARLQQLLFQA